MKNIGAEIDSEILDMIDSLHSKWEKELDYHFDDKLEWHPLNPLNPIELLTTIAMHGTGWKRVKWKVS